MLDPFIPSLIIVTSVAAAFAAGKVIAIVARRLPRMAKAVSIVVAAVALAFAILFATNGSSRYALFLPAGLALGYFTHGRRRIAPGVFE